MRKIIFTTFCLISVIFMACGSTSGPGSLTLKYPGNEIQEVPLKSGGYYTSTKTYNINGNRSTSSSYFICVANYEIDLSQGAISIGASVKGENQTKVCFSLNGEENGDEKTPLKTGSFPPAKSMASGPAYNSVDNASIRSFKDGKETKHFLNLAKTNGEIKITSVSGDTVNGEVNLSDGENEINGTFSAKAFKKK